jgi:type 2 lantibiotic biosynthesis protein LanM
LAELHRRLSSDWDTLTEYASVDSQKIDDLTVLTTDRHHDGRAIIRIEVGEGESLIYKPRSVRGEQIWYELVDNIFDKLQLDYDSPTIIHDSEDYGWVEHVPHDECKNRKEVSRYFNRTGTMLAICYMTYFSDLHFENIIASGAYPVIVDAETVLQPSTVTSRDNPMLREEVEESIIWTGYLPIKFLGDDSDMDGAGLENPPFDELQRPDTEWINVNTDRMTYQRGSSDPDDYPGHLPVLNGEVQRPDEYIEEILLGFKSVMKIAKHDDVSFIPEDMTSKLAQLNQRLIPRDTIVYESVLNEIIEVESLEDGLALTISCDKLLKRESADEIDAVADLYVSEFTSLLRLDVPHFTINSRNEMVDSNGTRVGGLIEKGGYERVRQRLSDIQPMDVTKQMEYIQSALSPMTPPVRTVEGDLLQDDL